MIETKQNKLKEVFIKDIVNDLNSIPPQYLKTIYSIIHTFKDSSRNQVHLNKFLENWLNTQLNDKTADSWDNLSDWEKEDINAGIMDLENGQYKDIEQVLAKYE
ncbi:MAG: hypothetical protein U9R19_00690 [Bacteroidota bacterium]|nr:hypothetical protein [Bacteroidota bacterium]